MYRKEGESRRSRDQKFYEFFISLQLEYITAELRYKIYPDGEKRQKSKEIMEKKKEKIKDIATRNSFKSIFEDICVGCTHYYDSELKASLYAQVYQEKGFPHFIYRDDLHRSQIEHLDRKFYYAVEVKFNTPDGVGLLKAVDVRGGVGYVEIGDEVNSYDLKEITRIF